MCKPDFKKGNVSQKKNSKVILNYKSLKSAFNMRTKKKNLNDKTKQMM